MFLEVEIKFAIDDDAITQLFQHPLLQQAQKGPVHHRLISSYFDTPGKQLRKLGFALRIRQQGQEFIQTLKGRSQTTSTEGVTARHEWEWPVPSLHLDLSVMPIPELQALAQQPQFTQALQLAFITDFERITWDVYYNDRTLIEVALDRGQITADTKAAPIKELELELKSGEIDDLHKVGAILARDLNLQVEKASKAARGFALLS